MLSFASDLDSIDVPQTFAWITKPGGRWWLAAALYDTAWQHRPTTLHIQLPTVESENMGLEKYGHARCQRARCWRHEGWGMERGSPSL